MTDFDLSAYLDIFKEDTAEQLQRMTDGLLALEADNSALQVVDELFRSAHTIKGSARMMDLSDIAALAHRMEDMLSVYRTGERAVSPAQESLLFSGLDVLRDMVQSAGTQQATPTPRYAAVMADLAAGLEPDPAPRDGADSVPPVGSTESASPAVAVRHREYLRVPATKVDFVLNLAGELATRDAAGERQVAALDSVRSQVREGARLLSLGDSRSALQLMDRATRSLETVVRLQRADTTWRGEVISDLYMEATRLRMLPMDNAFAPFHRSVRDLSVQRSKQVRLVTEGAEIEIDKLILDGLHEPLLHLIRNAVDHGIEAPEERANAGKERVGTVRVAARQQGGRVEITVSDDGRGLDLERVREVAAKRGRLTELQAEEATDEDLLALLFTPGFSTSEQITEISGRGVGLDAVRAAIAELDGQVSLESKPGGGTRFVLSLPLTLAQMRVLLVSVDEQIVALPAAGVDRVDSVRKDKLSWLQGQATVYLEGRTLPLVSLADALGFPSEGRVREELQVVVARSGAQRVALGVDQLLGEQDVVVKSLGPMLSGLSLVSAGTILPDGRVALVMNVHNLLASLARRGFAKPLPVLEEETQSRRVLVVDDAATTRELERAILVSAGYQVDTAVDGLDALEKLAQGGYDAVVTDVEMPRMDGLELTRAMRRDPVLREVPVVVVTTRESQDDRRRGLEAGAQAYLLKSAFDQDSLLAVLGRIIR